MNLEEARMFRLRQGKLPNDIGTPNAYKDEEFKWIPFLGNNPEGDKPYKYRGMFSFAHEEVGQTTIQVTGKRTNGMLEITVSGNDKIAEYFGVAAHRFAEAIFDTTTKPPEGIEEQMSSEIELLKREISRAHEEKKELEEKLDNFRKILE
mgnify:CR=1 FL=1|tara:strand:+ start:2050 stop:2499 length:450 start_codon:yes stop_codon:yes gene_type:complete